jgi:pSer/pThr/pTyr-binding forkhead associated (FHA) protein
MSAKLRVYPPLGEPFDKKIANTATIGRTGDNTVPLPGNQVSRKHAIVCCLNDF